MRASALRALALPAGPVERRRLALVSLSCALVGALVLAGLRIIRYTPDPNGENPGGWTHRISPYVSERGLRAGVVAAVVLACIPPLVLLIQAVRVGSAARERRLRMLRVSGASRRQLGLITSVEGAFAGLVGGLLAGPLYAVLGLVTSAAPTAYLRVVPTATWLDLLLWPAVAVVLAVVAGLAARLSAYDVSVSPEQANVRLPRPLGRSRRIVLAVLVVAVVGLTYELLWNPSSAYESESLLFLLIALTVAVMFVGAPYLVGLVARRQSGSADPMAVVAAARLRADLRTPGRVAAVVAVCGAAITFTFALASQSTFTSQSFAEDNSFYATGYGLAAGIAVIALVVCCLSLLVGAAEQIVDGRRATAALSAFGVGGADLSRGVRLQLRSSTVPAAAVGGLLAIVMTPLLLGGKGLLFGLTGLVLAVAAAEGATRLAAILLRPQLREAANVANLRTA